MITMIFRLLCLLSVCLMLLPGCGRDESKTTSQQAASPDTARYVTLAPAMSQILIDMGQQDHIVGIAEYDFTAAKNLPVVGNYLDVNTEKLLALKPTHVMMMTGKAGTPDNLKQLAQQFGFKLLAYPYPDTIADVDRIIFKTGDATNLISQANEASKHMNDELTAIKQMVNGLPKLKVLPVIGTDPIMASGSNTVINEMITQLGCINVAGDSPVSAPTYDREKLVTLDPDVVLLLMPDAPALADGLNDARLVEFKDLPITAVKNKHIVLVNDPLTFLPATTLPRIARQIALAIYPQLSETAADAK